MAKVIYRSRIRAIRERLRQTADPEVFTQSAVATHLGIARSSLARWEAGTQVPDALTALKLAALLGVTVEQLGFEEVP